jgi:hypothetical protein
MRKKDDPAQLYEAIAAIEYGSPEAQVAGDHAVLRAFADRRCGAHPAGSDRHSALGLQNV